MPRTVSPASIASTSSSSDAADPVAFEHLGEAELPLVEAQQFVEPDVGQPGDERDAVADLLDPADLFRLRPERGGAELRAGVVEPGVRRGRQRSAVMAEVREDLREVGAPAVAHDEMRPVQFQAGDQRRVGREGDLRMGPERLADQRRGSAS